MKLKNIRVEYSCEATVNTGNFTNVRPGYRISADVPEGTSASEVYEYLETRLDARLERKVDSINEELNS